MTAGQRFGAGADGASAADPRLSERDPGPVLWVRETRGREINKERKEGSSRSWETSAGGAKMQNNDCRKKVRAWLLSFLGFFDLASSDGIKIGKWLEMMAID